MLTFSSVGCYQRSSSICVKAGSCSLSTSQWMSQHGRQITAMRGHIAPFLPLPLSVDGVEPPGSTDSNREAM